MVTAVKEISGKEYAMSKLQDMDLDQIANWVRSLPEDRWKEIFIFYWPALAKKCGITEDTA
ncbi:hypothetical protein LJK88_23220 [Paenibacillus sp. P26]|nr:hypothetical protein LJK88_23220 [Paenibacillus sp. P26]UUZ95565.1 hypothetical protein LJK87_14640 [Paenibacillus sp. P25]